MDEVYEQPPELSELVDRCFGVDSYMSELTMNAVGAAAEIGAEASAALEYGLRPHLEALADGRDADPEQLVNYLRYFELTSARLKVTDHDDPLGRIERDFTADPHVHDGKRLRTMVKVESAQQEHSNRDEHSGEANPETE
ncbi:MAG TPA: hypothetical protein VMR18_00905 [Candidatus Saccharimonadales bacterium]|nr:hypothetical protein [Candidatus Saccharimonadales bacterium]